MLFDLHSLAQKRILVTGASGFLGHALAQYLEKYSVQVHRLSSNMCDLRNLEQTRQFLFDTQPHIVFHCAVQGGGIGWMKEHPVESGQDNIYINTNILQASYEAGVEKFVGVSSACVYPKFGQIPYTEDAIWEGYPEPLNSAYALSKRWMMELGKGYAKQYNFHAVFPILANIFGPGDHIAPDKAHVIADLLIRVQNKPSELLVWGTGVAEREFIYVDDAVEGIIACLHAPIGEFINIGTGISTKIKDLASTIVALSSLDIPIVFDSSKPDGQLRKVMDIDKSKKMLGWTAKMSLEEGLAHTISWYKSMHMFKNGI